MQHLAWSVVDLIVATEVAWIVVGYIGADRS